MAQNQTLLTPAARLVGGSLYEGQTTDSKGAPLVVKTGPNKGQAREDFYFGVAIPKGTEQHWAHTDWGRAIHGVGAAAFPHASQMPTFSWKITDGDSTVPNAKGQRPCDREGYPRHWVLHFSSGYAPRVYNKDGSQQIVEPGMVKTGYWVQVYGSVAGNSSEQSPGVYLNHTYVAFLGYDKEIVTGPDPKALGFGNVALPAGVSATPQAGAFVPPSAVAMPAAPAAVMPPPPAMPVTVAPNPAFAAPLPPAVPAMPPAPPAGPVMTAKAEGASYEQFRSQGWSDDQLRAHGYIQ